MPDVYGVLEELKREWVCHPLNLSQQSKRKGLSKGLPRREAGCEFPGKWQLRSSATAFSPYSAQLEERPGRGREARTGSQEVLPRVWPCLDGTRCQPALASILSHLSQASEGWASRQNFTGGGGCASQSDTTAPAEAREKKREAGVQEGWRPSGCPTCPATQRRHQVPPIRWARIPGGQRSSSRAIVLAETRSGGCGPLADRLSAGAGGRVSGVTAQSRPLWMGARAPGWGRSARVGQSPPDGSATPPQHPPAPPSRVVPGRKARCASGKQPERLLAASYFLVSKGGSRLRTLLGFGAPPYPPREGIIPLGAGVFPGTSDCGQPRRASSLP